MRILRRISAYLLVFCLLSCTVAAISAAVYADERDAVDDAAAPVASVGAADSPSQSAFKPRLTAPSYSNPYYYSDKNIFYEYGWGMPNCTCYAWGRAYELLGHEPNLCVYSAHLWYDYNREHGYYPCGSEPKLGAIACWKYTSGSSGHVAVVEKIENGKITFSNSAYSGVEFYIDTVPVNDPSDGRKTWIFQGYIYIGDFSAPADNTADKPAAASGMQYRITSESGVNMRTGAGTGCAVVTCLTFDQVVTVTDQKTADGYTWGCTQYDGTDGWFVLDFAEPLDAEDPPSASEPTVPATEPEEDPVLTAPKPSGGAVNGDVDSDGELTILDATHIQRILAKMVKPNDEMLAAGDVNRDGLLSILDANRIQCMLVNLS